MSLGFIILQIAANKKLPNSAPDSGIGLWIASQVIITLIVFVGVYYIFKPIFGKKPENNDEINDPSKDDNESR
jgi:hypothetical protein